MEDVCLLVILTSFRRRCDFCSQLGEAISSDLSQLEAQMD